MDFVLIFATQTDIMRKIFFLFLLLGIGVGLQAQQTDPAYVKKLDRLYKETVPLVQPAELEQMMAEGQKIIVLDTRAEREFEVSHIPGARFVDFDGFRKKDVADIPQDAKVIVYCSVGYRSERIGEKLQKLGFDDVSNLYGGIFEWKNQGKEVVDEAGAETEKVHTYNKDWGQWLLAGEKVYK